MYTILTSALLAGAETLEPVRDSIVVQGYTPVYKMLLFQYYQYFTHDDS
jgi:hypothetical protein